MSPPEGSACDDDSYQNAVLHLPQGQGLLVLEGEKKRAESELSARVKKSDLETKGSAWVAVAVWLLVV